MLKRSKKITDSSPHRTLGDDARDQRDWDRAAENYRLHLNARRDDFAIWVQLGHALKEAGKFGQALSAYSEAYRLNENDFDLHLSLGHLYKIMRLYELAEHHYSTSSSLGGNDFADPELATLSDLKLQHQLPPIADADNFDELIAVTIGQSKFMSATELTQSTTKISDIDASSVEKPELVEKPSFDLARCRDVDPLIDKTSRLRVLVDASSSQFNIDLIQPLVELHRFQCEIWCVFNSKLKSWMKPDLLIDHIPHLELPLYYSSVDIVIFTALDEFSEYKALTAIACGAAIYSVQPEVNQVLISMFEEFDLPVFTYDRLSKILEQLTISSESLSDFRLSGQKTAKNMRNGRAKIDYQEYQRGT